MNKATSMILAIWYFFFILLLVATVADYEEQTEEPTTTEQVAGNLNNDVTTKKDVDELIINKLQSSKKEQSNYIYIGDYTCTAYCPCVECCGKYALNRPKDNDGKEIVKGASGEVLTPQKSVAVDPLLIPLGTVLLIDGREYIAQDTGNFHGLIIDFYFETHEEAVNFGRQTKSVYIYKNVTK